VYAADPGLAERTIKYMNACLLGGPERLP